MDKINLGGKPYNSVGSSDSNLLLKTRGDLKVQWGNKFIDIIKNGKIASGNPELLKSIPSSDQITDNGIYLVTDSGEIWICIDGTKVNLQSEDDSSYVSFLVDQKEVTSEQKNRALRNIGFYYNSLTEAQSANISAGIIYIESDQKLYVVSGGKISEYKAITSSSNNNSFSSINIGKMEIYEEKGNIKINSPDLSLIVNNKQCLDINNDIILSTNINMKELCFIQSYGASDSNGFRLYTINGKSVLEVDEIVERNSTNAGTILNSSNINSQHNNVIVNATYNIGSVTCNLKYFNEFESGQEVFIYSDDTIILSVTYSDNIVKVLSSVPVPELVQVQITVNNSQIIIEISKGQYSGSMQISENVTSIGDYKILKGPQSVSFEGTFLYKKIPNKYTITAVGNNYITINSQDEDFPSKCVNALVCVASEPYIKTENNIMSLMEGDQVHTQIGVVNEQEIQSLKQCPSQIESPSVGIYSNNFIGLNSKFYDSIFKKRCDYPKYDQSVSLPDKPNDDQYNQIVPNIAWIKELLKYAVPSGTIVMYNGKSSIPEGWAVCDGSNGTPNLVGKFIKAVSRSSDMGDNSTDLNSSNQLTIKEENLPSHSHPHSSHTHTINSSGSSGSSGNLSMSSSDTFAFYLSKTTVVSSVTGVEGLNTGTTEVYNGVTWRSVSTSGGSHSHSVSVNSTANYSTSQEARKTWQNKAIKVEPHSYSLIFIMKL